MKIFHGNFVCAKDKNSFLEYDNYYITVDDNGFIVNIQSDCPCDNTEIIEMGGGLVIPAFSDLHMHSAQQQGTGLGYDDYANWFPLITKPNEAKYTHDNEYSHKSNSKLIWRLWKNGIMNSVIMCTEGLFATEDLILQMSKTGMQSYIGKMNSDYGYFGRPHETTEKSINDTDYLIEKYSQGLGGAHLILSPEFIPACSENILEYLGQMAKKYNLPVHSHLAETDTDTKAVKDRFDGKNYSEVYKQYGLLGDTPTIMAHCMTIDENEIPLLSNENVIAVHCPTAALDVPGVAHMNVRKLLDNGVKIAMGCDVGGGHTFSMPRNLVYAAQLAKQLRITLNQETVTMTELYYCATVNGGKFFGKSGKFEKGYQFDALLIDDKTLREDSNYTLSERLLRYLYCSDECEIKERYVKGNLIKEPKYDPIN